MRVDMHTVLGLLAVAPPFLQTGPTKMTPLHMAASWHKPEVVSALLNAGADPTRMDVNGLGYVCANACLFACRSMVRNADMAAQTAIDAATAF